MKRIQSKAYLLKRRVRSVQGKAKFVGITYLLGTLALAAAAAIICMLTGTCLTTENGLFPVLAFYYQVVGLFTGEGGIAAILTDAALLVKAVCLVIYLILLIVVLINVFVALSKLGWLFKRKASYTNGFNRNMYAMDDISKCYASSLTAIVICNLLIWLLSVSFVDGVMAQQPTLYGYIVLGGGVLIHFLGGLFEGTVSLFTTGEKIEEETREYGMFIYFIRNLIQIAAIGGILFYFIPQSQLGAKINEILTELVINKNMTWFMDNILALIPFAVELLAWIFIMLMIGHALNSTEFRREGVNGSGMKNYAVFSFLTFLCAAALIALPYFGIGGAPKENFMENLPMIIVGGIALVVFLFDCICRSRKRKKEAEFTEAEAQSDEVEQAPVAMQPQPVVPMQQPMMQMPYQPIYVPVYYPMPTANNQQAPSAVTVPFEAPFAEPYVRPEPAPAPMYILPAPSPEAQAREEAEKEEEEVLDPNKTWQVRCPRCGKELIAREVSPYHRCPACDKVFKIRKFQGYVKKDNF